MKNLKKLNKNLIGGGILFLIIILIIIIIVFKKDHQDTKKYSSTTVAPSKLSVSSKSFPETTTFLSEILTTTTIAPTTTITPTTTIAPTTTITPTTTIATLPKLTLTYTSSGSVSISTTQKIIGDYSCYLPGSSSNRLVISNFPSSTYLSGDWTIEFFLYLPSQTSISSSEISPITFSSEPASSGTMLIYPAYYKSNNTLTWFVGSSSSTTWDISNNQFTSNPNTETWNHIAMCYTSNTKYQFFCNGVLTGTSTSTTNIGTRLTNINLGALAINDGYYIGGYETYIDGLRISNNVRYTSNYTVPTSYTIDSNTIYINSFEGSFEP